jgi:hypothetical protein
VYNRVDDYAEAASHSTLGRKATDEHVQMVRSSVSQLEALISGARSRYAAGHTLHTIGGVSRLDMLASTSSVHNGASAERSGESSCRVSLLQNPGRWVELEEGYVASMRAQEEERKALASTATSGGKQKKENKRRQQQEAKKANKGNKGQGGVKGKAGAVEAVPVVVHSIPPSFAPIPCKPIFYDIALNYLDAEVSDILDVKCGVKKKKAVQGTAKGAATASTGGGVNGVSGGEDSSGIVGSLFGWFSGR